MKPTFLKSRRRWSLETFERETKAFLPELSRLARRLAAQPADADDLVHDTYLKAYQAFEKAEFRDAAECRAWLYRILANTYRDSYRRRMRSPEIAFQPHLDEETANVVDLIPSPEPGPEKQLERKRFAEAAEAAIATLPPEVRFAVVLFFIQDLSYKEIADAMDCPLGTVMSRLSRGRAALRDQLQAYAVGSQEETPRRGSAVIKLREQCIA